MIGGNLWRSQFETKESCNSITLISLVQEMLYHGVGYSREKNGFNAPHSYTQMSNDACSDLSKSHITSNN